MKISISGLLVLGLAVGAQADDTAFIYAYFAPPAQTLQQFMQGQTCSSGAQWSTVCSGNYSGYGSGNEACNKCSQDLSNQWYAQQGPLQGMISAANNESLDKIPSPPQNPGRWNVLTNLGLDGGQIAPSATMELHLFNLDAKAGKAVAIEWSDGIQSCSFVNKDSKEAWADSSSGGNWISFSPKPVRTKESPAGSLIKIRCSGSGHVEVRDKSNETTIGSVNLRAQ